MSGVGVGLALGLAAAPALADDVTASAPVDVSATIYRAPSRNGGNLQLRQLGGFAVITETRRVTLPAGESRLRFEGVVEGIIPESAIVSGLPGGVVEKNRDAALLSPSALLRAAVGGRVTLKRTDPKTGKARLIPAEIESASDEGVMLRTADGIEVLRCSGLPETFRFERTASGLSATPTLSVVTRSRRAVSATVTLTYIAEAFDWAANYTARINPDGKTMDLGGWITLANGNSISLHDASAQIVAGGLNREYFQRFLNPQPRVVAKCYPLQRTSDIPLKPDRPYSLVQPYLGQANQSWDDQIIVTGSRVGRANLEMPMPVSMMSAPPPPPPPVAEQLGDLKLYRVPQRTTIAANQMKQTRLVEQPSVAFERILTGTLSAQTWSGNVEVQQGTILLRTRNDKEHGLGLPLPAGAVVIEQEQFGRAMVVGQPGIRDLAENEKVELALGTAPDITITRTVLQTSRGGAEPAIAADLLARYRKGVQVQRVELANATAEPVSFELKLQTWGAQRVTAHDRAMGRQDGQPIFVISLPANDTVTLHYTVEG